MIEYRYLRDGRVPIGCLAMDNETGDVGISVCSPKDQFSKKLARKISAARITKSWTIDSIPNRTVKHPVVASNTPKETKLITLQRLVTFQIAAIRQGWDGPVTAKTLPEVKPTEP